MRRNPSPRRRKKRTVALLGGVYVEVDDIAFHNRTNENAEVVVFILSKRGNASSSKYSVKTSFKG
jgi:hypothetical protein